MNMTFFKNYFKKSSTADITNTVPSSSAPVSPYKSTHTDQAEPGLTAHQPKHRGFKSGNIETSNSTSTFRLPVTTVTSPSDRSSLNKTKNADKAEHGPSAHPALPRSYKRENNETSNRTPPFILPVTTDKDKAIGRQSMIVAAFDFGTTYSGYAFSLKSSPNDVITNKSWTAGSGKLISLKTPTSVLLNQNGEFDSFGFDAEDKYSSLSEAGKHHGWRLFRRFKMILHNQRISRSVAVEDLEGKPVPARSIFAMSIKYLQKHLLEALNISKIGIKETDIRYIVTVPAIWGIAAKQFMREAVIEAGIDGDRLKLALEPEAAAVSSEALGHTLAGQKFMVVDIGGGTADLSVHEKQVDGSLKNIHAPSGGPWGGIYVDANFTTFMAEVFGTEAITALQSNEMYDFFEMIRDFEVKKKNFQFDSQADITFRIPLILKEKAVEHFEQSLSDRLASLEYGDKVFSRGRDKLGVHSCIMESWFADPVSDMVNHISSVLKEERMKDVGLVILVGGFAESPYVQQRIQEAVPERRLIVPGEAGLAVLKGAVMFGHKPDIISSRVMDYTYGININRSYDESKYPKEKKVLIRGEWVVCSIFEIFVRINEEVGLNTKVSHETCTENQFSTIKIFRTKEAEPSYTTDPGCELLGELHVIHNEDIPRKTHYFETSFMFGDTELLIVDKNLESGQEETLTLDLNN